jgi:hypothetical protein
VLNTCEQCDYLATTKQFAAVSHVRARSREVAGVCALSSVVLDSTTSRPHVRAVHENVRAFFSPQDHSDYVRGFSRNFCELGLHEMAVLFARVALSMFGAKRR